MFEPHWESAICLLLFFVSFIVADFHVDGAIKFPARETKTIPNQKLPKMDLETTDDIVWLNRGSRSSPNLTPFISVGVLSNMEEFFENLSSRMNQIRHEKTNEIDMDVHNSPFEKTLVDHQLRGYKPSKEIRNYVQSPEPLLLRGTNQHNPSLKWAGLGKRKRTAYVV